MNSEQLLLLVFALEAWVIEKAATSISFGCLNIRHTVILGIDNDYH